MLGSLVKLEEQRRRHTDLTQRLIRVMDDKFGRDAVIVTDDGLDIDAQICPSTSIQGLSIA